MKPVLQIAALGCALTLAACGGGRTEIAFQGEVYRATSTAGDPRESFTATARPVGAGPAGAVLAAEHEGKRYCIENFGTSDIVWDIGPDSDPAALPVEGDAVTLAGTCDPW